MKLETLKDLYVEQLQDLYNAEEQIIDALPKMIEECSSPELRHALEEHLEITNQQLKRVEQLFEEVGEESPDGHKCKGIEGIIEEGEELLEKDATPAVKDAAIIASAQRVEHYEIAGYGTARTFARLLGLQRAAELLEQTLEEEKDADMRLSEIAEAEVNEEAAQEMIEGGAEASSEGKSRGRKSAK